MWIEHDGNGMPIDGSTPVSVMFRGRGAPSYTRSASFWCWKHYGYLSDIVAYKVM